MGKAFQGFELAIHYMRVAQWLWGICIFLRLRLHEVEEGGLLVWW